MPNFKNIKDFTNKLKEIKKQGFIKSMRKGPTGIGLTLETLLGINENNIALPDIGFAELKSTRLGTSNLITLFTFNRKAWVMKPLEAIKKYGSPDKDPSKHGRLGLYYTMSLTPNSAGLFLYIDNNILSVRHISGEIVTQWNLEDVKEQFIKKLPALILVYAEVEEKQGVEYFHYNRACLLKDVSVNSLINAFKEEHIVIDLRLHDKGTSARNHGTGFRIKEAYLDRIFANKVELDI